MQFLAVTRDNVFWDNRCLFHWHIECFIKSWVRFKRITSLLSVAYNYFADMRSSTCDRGVPLSVLVEDSLHLLMPTHIKSSPRINRGINLHIILHLIFAISLIAHDNFASWSHLRNDTNTDMRRVILSTRAYFGEWNYNGQNTSLNIQTSACSTWSHASIEPTINQEQFSNISRVYDDASLKIDFLTLLSHGYPC